MNDELEIKNITIAGVEDVQWGVKLTDEKGLKYNISKFLKGTQNETKAFQVLKTLPGYGIGLQKCVKFATVPNSAGGQSRYVRIIGEVEEDTGDSHNVVYQPKTSPQGKFSDKIGSVASQSDDIRANVALKMVSEILSAGVVPITEWQKWADAFYNYVPNDKPIMEKLNEAGLTKAQEDDINLSEIPF